MTRLLFINNIPSPYVIDRLNELERRGEIQLQAAFEQRSHPDRSWQVSEADWRFRATYVGVGWRGALSLVWLIVRTRPDVVYTLYAGKSFVAAIIAARLTGARVVIKAMKTFEAWRPRSRAREMAKRLIFPYVAIHTTGPDGTAYAMRYGASDSHIFAFPEPVAVERFAGAARESRREGRCHRETVFLYVGRVWRGKGVDLLIEAFQELTRSHQARLMIVGDGVDRDRLQRTVRAGDSISFLPFLEGDGLPRVYRSADVFVFPTLGDPYGHVVQEAMASGLPVIASDAAADIRQRVSHGVTGFVVRAGDKQALVGAMALLAGDESLRASMGLASYDAIKSFTVEWWAGAFAEMILAEGSRNVS